MTTPAAPAATHSSLDLSACCQLAIIQSCPPFSSLKSLKMNSVHCIPCLFPNQSTAKCGLTVSSRQTVVHPSPFVVPSKVQWSHCVTRNSNACRAAIQTICCQPGTAPNTFAQHMHPALCVISRNDSEAGNGQSGQLLQLPGLRRHDHQHANM